MKVGRGVRVGMGVAVKRGVMLTIGASVSVGISACCCSPPVPVQAASANRGTIKKRIDFFKAVYLKPI